MNAPRANERGKTRLMQCPGCWAGGFVAQEGDWQECDCGEKLMTVDLRGELFERVGDTGLNEAQAKEY